MCNSLNTDEKKVRCLTPHPLLLSAVEKTNNLIQNNIDQEFYKKGLNIFWVYSDELYCLLLSTVSVIPNMFVMKNQKGKLFHCE